jgi:hypothetical protein
VRDHLIASPEENPQGSSGGVFSVTMSCMASLTFDDPGLRAAMRTYLEACDALDKATDDTEVVGRSDAKRLAGLALRQRLVAQGWTAPLAQRSRT